jgi:hypothetical protein
MIRMLTLLVAGALLSLAACAETMAADGKPAAIVSDDGATDIVQVLLQEPDSVLGRLRAYPSAQLPPPGQSGRLVRVPDHNDAIYQDTGAAWRPLGDFIQRVRALDAAGPHSIGGPALEGSFLEVTGAMISQGTANAMRILTKVSPGLAGKGGDGYGLFVSPTFVVGPPSSIVHKRLATLRVDYPGAHLVPGGTDVQETDAIFIGATASFPEPKISGSSPQGNYAIRIASGYPSRFTGALQIDAAGQPNKNIQVGSSTYAIALDLHGVWQAPDAGQVGWFSRMQGAFNTASSGTHPDLGGLEVVTPTVAKAQGASVKSFTTLKVGAAPAAVGGAAVRALWVGAGLSEISGTLALNMTQFTERSDPAAPAAHNVYVYTRDNGAGKTQLCARFATGAVQCFASQP